METKQYITVRIVDRRKQKITSVLYSAACFLLVLFVLFGAGIIFDSAPIQWAGFIIFLLFVALFVSLLNSSFLTIEEARKRLDELEQDSHATISAGEE